MEIIIELALLPKPSKKDDSIQLEKALSAVGLEDLKDWRIGKLSGGQQQRVFIARAIVNKPEILFLDEPTTGVDTRTHDDFYKILIGVQPWIGNRIFLGFA